MWPWASQVSFSLSLLVCLPPDCYVDLAKWSTEGPGAAMGMSYGHLTSLPGFPSSLLVVSSSFSPSVSCFTLMAIVTSQLNMTLPASWPVCLQIPSDTQGSQREGCSFPSSLSVSLAFSNLIALTWCSRACVQSGPKEPSCINTRLSSCFCPHFWIPNIFVCSLQPARSVLELVVLWSLDQQYHLTWESVRNTHPWVSPRTTRSETLDGAQQAGF